MAEVRFWLSDWPYHSLQTFMEQEIVSKEGTKEWKTEKPWGLNNSFFVLNKKKESVMKKSSRHDHFIRALFLH